MKVTAFRLRENILQHPWSGPRNRNSGGSDLEREDSQDRSRSKAG